MMNAKRTAIALAGALGVAALTTLPASAAPPAPDDVSVEVATVNGSGCPQGTSSVVISEDRTAFTVNYSEYLAYAGGDASPVNSRKNCQINLRVNAPANWTYGIIGADHRGFAGLEEGASGLVRTNYYFQGHPTNQVSSHQLKGRYVDDWTFRDRFSPSEVVYKPCGESRNLNLNTELRVNAGSSDSNKMSFLSMDSTHSSARYLFAWKRCS
ncbi:DUF4360 domain-containing protein [Actinomadura terrae]|uniref:DUF4360 domain-containing protein n=1 Tax=Actinomadura terrae TaxID=604353 RepID=UPI001FA75961|nr:DUF4360 domain-containing protein [Actinomadura terrae]